MAANDVNEILVKLLAAAENIHGPVGHELLSLVSRLSGAATRERSAAVDEMQRLRKKVIQQQGELKRLGSMQQHMYATAQRPPSHQAAHATPPARAPPAPMVAGYEHFNQERLLAIQAAPNAQARAGPATLPYHPLMDDSPKPSAMKVTAANTVPLAPRKTLLSKDHKTHDREVDELVRNLRNAAASQDRALKHKRSDSDLRDESSKKRKIEPAFMPQVLSPRDLSGSPMSFSCVRCICERSDCDGASQCAYCRAAGSKCVYLLCGKHGDCQTLDCRLIHDWQYDESSRKHGQVRRNVLGGTVHSERLARSVIEQLSNAQVLMQSNTSSDQTGSINGLATADSETAHTKNGATSGAPVIKSEDFDG